MNYGVYATQAVPGSVPAVQEPYAYASGVDGLQTQPYGAGIAQVAPGTAIPSVYGEQRPAEVSSTTHISMLASTVPSNVYPDVSFDTNSKDPVMVRSRVFIGRLNSAPVTRDDLITLFKPFGHILALNHFKQGFGFVQFSQPSEADAAVSSLNGKKWMGVIIDVHHVDLAVQAKKRAELESSRKRTGEEDESLSAKLLRAAEFAPLDEVKQQNLLNRAAALGSSTVNEDLFHTEMADTMICGTCRFVTADFELFKDHRIAGCQRKKAEEEPTAFKCASCDSRFKSAWSILCHLTEFHRMMLFKVEQDEPQKDQQTKDEQSKRAVSNERSSITPEPSPKISKTSLDNSYLQKQSVSSQPQTSQRQQTLDGRVASSNSASSSHNAAYGHSAANQPVYAHPAYTQSYGTHPGLRSPFNMPAAPEPPKDSIITGTPVRYPNGSSSSSR
ncbi:unnamed protein product [Cylicocyclus nassatus]|uniref:RRM domain-containing protein n=1 Tax=Cylicocyclus nassatus TaxID=53992 RepID=A0AA36LZD8_CYLNA|nr:unnamed protein product [Cylicocyclus nassatus]